MLIILLYNRSACNIDLKEKPNADSSNHGIIGTIVDIQKDSLSDDQLLHRSSCDILDGTSNEKDEYNCS